MVREHVLKGKDPNQILEELEKLDELGQSLNIFTVQYKTYGDTFSISQ